MQELTRWRGTGAARVLLPLMLAGCSAPALTAGGAKVEIIKGDPPAGCVEVGSVEEASGAGDEAIKTKLRNSAAEKGANLIRFETTEKIRGATKYTGTAFKCPDK